MSTEFDAVLGRTAPVVGKAVKEAFVVGDKEQKELAKKLAPLFVDVYDESASPDDKVVEGVSEILDNPFASVVVSGEFVDLVRGNEKPEKLSVVVANYLSEKYKLEDTETASAHFAAAVILSLGGGLPGEEQEVESKKKKDKKKRRFMGLAEDEFMDTFNEISGAIDEDAYENEEERMQAVFVQWQEQHPEHFEALGREFAAGIDMYKGQSEKEQRLVKLNPEAYFRNAFLGVMESGQTHFKMMANEVMQSPYADHEHGWALAAALQLPGMVDGIKRAGDEKQAMGMVGYVTPENYIGLQDFSVPLWLKLEDSKGGERNEEVSLSINSAADYLFRNADFRYRLFHKNSRSRQRAQIEFPRLLMAESINMQPTESIVAADFADVNALVDSHSLKGWASSKIIDGKNPALDMKKLRDFQESLHLTNTTGLRLESDRDFMPWLGTWSLKGAEAMVLPFGGIVDMFPIVNEGRYPYWFRAGLDGDGYLEVYHIGVWTWRGYGRTGYGSLMSENLSKIDPIMGLEKLPEVSPTKEKLGLVGLDVSEVLWGTDKELARQAKEILDYVKMDRPLMAWLKPYEQQIFEGETIVFDTLYSPVNLPEGTLPKGVSRNGRLVTVNFGEQESARVFVQHNRTSKGRMRMFDEVLEVYDNLDQPARDVLDKTFKGVKVFELVGIEAKDLAATDGYAGLREALKATSFKDMLWENLDEYSMWKWWYYYISSKATHGMLSNFFQSTIVGSDIKEDTAEERDDRVAKEYGQMYESFAGLKGGMAWASASQRAEKILELSVGVVNNCAPRKHHERSNVYEYVYDPKSGEDFALTRVKATSLDGRQKSLGFKKVGLGRDAVLVGPGGHGVFTSREVARGSNDYPTRIQFNSRPVTIGALELMLTQFGVDTGQVAMGRVTDYLAKIKDEKIVTELVTLTSGEKLSGMLGRIKTK